MTEVINYTPPTTVRGFIKEYIPGQLSYSWIVGPVGSGKTTGLFFKLVYLAKQQEKGPDGIRRTRAVVVRNTLPQLRDTTLSSWNYWFKDGQAGTWRATENKFILRFDDVECEVLFRPLDTPEDVARVLSLEVTFALIDEFVEIPRQIIDALSARVGRYPSKKDGGATNWAIFGSSNPSTEDNWWYEYLHDVAVCAQPDEQMELDDTRNAHYWLQPSGFSPNAENLENLPGGVNYYHNQAKGKSNAWIKQFIESEWGYSIAGKPVIATFNSDMHLAKTPIHYDPQSDLILGLDPGLGGSAVIFGQEDMHGRLKVLGELVQQGYGAERMIRERIKPYLRRRFPEAKVVVAPDPASANRAQTDERAVIDEFKKHFSVKIETNNRLAIRLDAIEHFTTRLTDVGPALLIDAKECPVLVRALKGGWRYVMDVKKGIVKGTDPEKNAYSHPGDAFGYLCRYFHKQNERNTRYYGYNQAKPFTPPRVTGAGYHIR